MRRKSKEAQELEAKIVKIMLDEMGGILDRCDEIQANSTDEKATDRLLKKVATKIVDSLKVL